MDLLEAIRELLDGGKLQELRLKKSWPQFTKEHFEKFFLHFPEKDYPLLVLDVSGSRIGDSAARTISEYLKKNQTLTTLGLYSTGLNDSTGLALAEALTRNRRLEVLLLGGNEFYEETAKALCDALWTNTKLIECTLQGVRETAQYSHEINRLTSANRNLWPFFKIIFIAYLRGKQLSVLPKEVLVIIIVFFKQLLFIESPYVKTIQKKKKGTHF